MRTPWLMLVAVALSVAGARAAIASANSEIEAKVAAVPFINYLFPSLVVFLAGVLIAIMMYQRARR